MLLQVLLLPLQVVQLLVLQEVTAVAVQSPYAIAGLEKSGVKKNGSTVTQNYRNP